MWLLLEADPSEMSYKDSVALCISLLALLVSYLAYLNTKKTREPRVSLTTSFHTRLVGDRQTNVLTVTITNTGPVDVTVEDIGLEGADGKTLRPKMGERLRSTPAQTRTFAAGVDNIHG